MVVRACGPTDCTRTKYTTTSALVNQSAPGCQYNHLSCAGASVHDIPTSSIGDASFIQSADLYTLTVVWLNNHHLGSTRSILLPQSCCIVTPRFGSRIRALALWRHTSFPSRPASRSSGKKSVTAEQGTRLHTLEMQTPISTSLLTPGDFLDHSLPSYQTTHPPFDPSLDDKQTSTQSPTDIFSRRARAKARLCRNVGARVLTLLGRFERTLPARVRTADHRHRRRRSRKVGREGGREGGSPARSR